MNALLAKLAGIKRAWHRMRTEALIIQIDRDIDGIRALRRHDEERERELDECRAYFARKLQAMAQAEINHRSAANVRALSK